MPRRPKPSLKSIVAAVTPAATGPEARVVQLAGNDKRAGAVRGRLKDRTRQLSVYLEPGVYDQLRDIAYTERTKMHPLLLEALDLLFRKRGALSIKEIEARAAR
jgi:hypothetical protein